MAIIKFVENYYNFRNTATVIGRLISPQSRDEIALGAIEAKLTEAHNYYLSKQYQKAIDSYKEAEALIYVQLDPGFHPSSIHQGDYLRNPDLFDSLLSVALEWTNILPTHQSFTTVRPRVAVNENLLGSATKLRQKGLSSSPFASFNAASAVAD